MIDKLYQIFMVGSLHERDRDGNTKKVYSWHCSIKDTVKVLKQVYPYLVTKKDIAKYTLEYIGRRSTQWEIYPNMGGRNTFKPLHPAEIAQRDFFVGLLKALNKKGK